MIITGASDVTVSLTSFSHRVRSVHLAIESIAAGSRRPGRLILWLDEPATLADLPRPLRRLRKRGLEIRQIENLGPHKKYWGLVAESLDANGVFVTADDDVYYPAYWLSDLLRSNEADPDMVHCHRAHRVCLDGRQFAPYDSWPLCFDSLAGFDVLQTGVSGVIYPHGFLGLLRNRGLAFLEVCPMADDIWLHNTALRARIPVRQIAERPREFQPIVRARAGGLFNTVNANGGNDVQIARTYSSDDKAVLRDSSKLRGRVQDAE